MSVGWAVIANMEKVVLEQDLCTLSAVVEANIQTCGGMPVSCGLRSAECCKP